MPQSIADLINRAGEPLFREYSQRKTGFVPDDFEAASRAAFGMEAMAWVSSVWSKAQTRLLRMDFQRVLSLADSSGRDCLKFSALRLRDDVVPTESLRSAFQEALFFFLHSERVFRLAERMRIESRYRYRTGYYNTFRYPSAVSLMDMPVSVRFRDAVGEFLRSLANGPVDFVIESSVEQPLYPVSPEREYHLLVFWGDDREGISTLQKKEFSFVHLPKLRVIGLAYNPARQALSVCGPYLQRPGRTELADLFVSHLLNEDGAAQLMRPERYDLDTFPNRWRYDLPRQLDIRTFGLTRFAYRRGASGNRTSREVTFPLPIRTSMLADYADQGSDEAARMVRRELQGIEVDSVDFRLELSSSRLFPDGRLIEGRLCREGFSLKSKLDVDIYIVSQVLDALRVSADHAPLLKVG